MSRLVTISTTSILDEGGPAYPSKCIDRAFAAVQIAGERGSDIVVVPEEIDIIGVDHKACPNPMGVCEPVPGGPITTRMQELAGKYGMYVVLGVRELDGDVKYNTAALIGREGEIVGKYRKTHLMPTEELEVRAGDDLPVFETDFGRVAVGLCMDIHYEEMYRVYSLKGADIIFWPTMCIDYTGNCIESIVNARAFDNQLYFVSSHPVQMPFLTGRSMGHSRIVDPYGRTVADTSHHPGVATATVDLDQVYELWYSGEMKREWPTMREAIHGRRRPELYGILSQPDTEKRWKLANPTLYKAE